MATIRVARSSEFMNRLRDFGVYIDGVKVGTIGNGETKDFPVAEGDHKVYTKIDWCYSPERSFTISGSSVTKFNTGGFKNSSLILGVFLVVILLRAIIGKSMSFDFFPIIEVLMLAGIVYILTIGRKKYLSLTEDTSTDNYVPYSK